MINNVVLVSGGSETYTCISLGREDSLEKGMTTHSSILASRIQWTESLEGYTVWRVAKSQT